MTDEQTDLARQLVRAPWWRWMESMTIIPVGYERERWLLCWTAQEGADGEWEAGAYQTSGGKWWGIATSEDPMVLSGDAWLPDLTDLATAGCLLALLVERAQADGWRVHLGAYTDTYTVSVLQPYWARALAEGHALGEAVARCLLALEVDDAA